MHDAESRTNVSNRTVTLPLLQIPHLRLGALVAIGLVTFLVGWLVLGNDDERPAQQPTGASEASEAQLREVAATAPHPVYWAGAREGHTYELTKTDDGRLYVRYLPEGVKPGDPRPDFLTVGTYPRTNAWAELKRAARAPGATTRELSQGGLLVLSEGSSSVYFGYPDAAYQVEVYTPSAGAARKLVLEGRVVPIR